MQHLENSPDHCTYAGISTVWRILDSDASSNGMEIVLSQQIDGLERLNAVQQKVEQEGTPVRYNSKWDAIALVCMGCPTLQTLYTSMCTNS